MKARVAGINAAESYSLSMRQKIDVAAWYAKALQGLPGTTNASRLGRRRRVRSLGRSTG
jgi:hypothetical protein